MFIFEKTFQGGLLINKEDLYAAVDRRGAGRRCSRSSSRRPRPGARCAPSPTTTRRRSRSASRSTASGSSSGASRASSRSSPASSGARKLGVQFSLSLVALKALPVVILGGLTSIPGAIIGGLIIGVGEKLSEIYLGPHARRRHRDLVRLRAGARRSCWSGRKGCSARRSSTACSAGHDHALPRKRPVQDELPRRPADLSDPAGPDRDRPCCSSSPSSSCRSSRPSTCCARS